MDGNQKIFTVEASKATDFRDKDASLLEDVKITIFGKKGERHDLIRTQSCQYEKEGDRKSTRLNSSHGYISYAVFCLKKKNTRIAAASHEEYLLRYVHYRLLCALTRCQTHSSEQLIIIRLCRANLPSSRECHSSSAHD